MRRKKFEDWIVFSDNHVPFHNKTLHRKLFQIIKDVKPYGIAILGDFVDLVSLSRFDEGSLEKLTGITLKKEYELGRRELDDIDSAAPRGCKKVFVMGNHDEGRYLSFIARADHAKFKGSIASPAEGLRLIERSYTVVNDWENGYYVLGQHLELIHGVSTTIHAAKVHLDKFQGSVMSGHAHIIQHYCTNKRGSWIIGGLFDLKSKGFDWAGRGTKERWSNGFAYVVINGQGLHYVHLVHVFNDRFIFGAHLI